MTDTIDTAAIRARTPENIAQDIVKQFSWTSNVMVDGRLVGQQVVVAFEIAEAIKAERDELDRLRAELAQARASVWEEAAKIADAEYNEQARIASIHRSENNEAGMDRRNAAARAASNIASDLRAAAQKDDKK